MDCLNCSRIACLPNSSRPADFTPRKSEQNTYDIGYYKRQDTRTNAFTGVDVAKAAELRNMKECPEKYQVMPAHLPRPVWWDRQETVDREARERGILYAGGELPELELKVIESEQDNDDGQATRTTPEDVAAGRTKKFQLYT